MDPFDRHHGAIRRIAEESLAVRDITMGNIWGPAPDDAVASTLARMETEDYDTAPVIESPLTRFVTRQSLASLPGDAPVRDAARTISTEDLVTSTLPLADALQLLNERKWYFVIEGHEIKGILTIADLQSLTVSLVTLGFVLAAEAGIDALIDLHTPLHWHKLLTKERLARIESVFEQRRSRNAEIDRRACLNLDDRLRILSKSAPLRAALGMSRTRLDKTSEAVKRLRDSLAHGASIIDVGDDPQEGIRMAQHAREFADHIWATLASQAPATDPVQ